MRYFASYLTCKWLWMKASDKYLHVNVYLFIIIIYFYFILTSIQTLKDTTDLYWTRAVPTSVSLPSISQGRVVLTTSNVRGQEGLGSAADGLDVFSWHRVNLDLTSSIWLIYKINVCLCLYSSINPINLETAGELPMCRAGGGSMS